MKIISGGQTGIDQIALELAKKHGFETGGYCPNNYITEIGSQEELLKSYGLVPYGSYKQRTYKNVEESDITLLFTNFLSPGFKCTLNACEKYKKPLYSNIYISLQLYEWMKECDVVNVAGHRQSKLDAYTEKMFRLHFEEALMYLKIDFKSTLF